MSKISGGSLAVLLLVAISTGGYSSLLSHRLDLARRQSAEQQKTLAQQAKLITSLRTDDARNRALMAEQQRRAAAAAAGEIYQRKYREAIKNDECARRAAPGAVLGILRGTDTAAASADHPVAPESVFKNVRNQRCMVKHGATLAVMHWHCKWLYQPVLAVALNQWRMEVIKAKMNFMN